MSKKKLVVIGPCYPYRGGIATFVAHLCKGLSEKFDVHLINYSLLYPSVLFPGKTQYDESKSLTFNFPNTRLLNSINPLSWIKVARAIKKENPDLIIMDWWNPFFSFCFRGIFTFLHPTFKNKILVIAENVVSHEGRKIDAALTKMGISIGSQYLVLSDKVAEEIKPYANNKPIHKAHLPIYNTFNTTAATSTKASLGYSEDDYVLLFFGYIRKYKGLDIALEAFPTIKKSIPNAKLLVVGESYDAWEEYQDLIDKHQLQNDVQVISAYVPNEAVAQYFNASDLVLLPYRTATQSGILNIAYGFLKPVVATNVGGFSEFIDDGTSGLLVQSIEPQAFAEAVIHWYAEKRNSNYTKSIEDIVNANGFGKINGIIDSILK